jgi:serine/threonine protein kinase
VPIRCPHCRASFDPAEQATEGARSGGAAIGRFELVALLERTPFGITRYRARDPYLDRSVRLTLGPRIVRGAPLDRLLRAGPPSGDDALDRFLHEARLLARLHHPAIPAVYEVGIVDDLPYLAGRHVEGRTLAERERDGSSPADDARLIAALADAVHHVHEHGIVLRDIRPGTILVDEHGRPHLTDLARALPVGQEDGAGDDEPLWGNPAYVSPERLRDEGHRLDGRNDIYGLGLVLYELLTGRLPFPTEPMPEEIRHKLEEDPTPPRSLDRRIDRRLEAICLKALARDPDDRYPTAAALAEDLRGYLAGRSPVAGQAGRLGRFWVWSRPARRRPR